eukprot:349881-Chlamydomonas_euryale.AAC.4
MHTCAHVIRHSSTHVPHTFGTLALCRDPLVRLGGLALALDALPIRRRALCLAQALQARLEGSVLCAHSGGALLVRLFACSFACWSPVYLMRKFAESVKGMLPLALSGRLLTASTLLLLALTNPSTPVRLPPDFPPAPNPALKKQPNHLPARQLAADSHAASFQPWDVEPEGEGRGRGGRGSYCMRISSARLGAAGGDTKPPCSSTPTTFPNPTPQLPLPAPPAPPCRSALVHALSSSSSRVSVRDAGTPLMATARPATDCDEAARL